MEKLKENTRRKTHKMQVAFSEKKNPGKISKTTKKNF